MIKAKKVIANTEDLVLRCLCPAKDEEVMPAVRRLAETGIDWELFKENAFSSGLYLMIYNRLKGANRGLIIPEGLLGSLKDTYLYAVSKTYFRHNETKYLLSLFNKNNVPVVVLKGEKLAERLYGDIAARGISSDLDLLVEEGNKAVAAQILTEAGYSFDNPLCGDADSLWQHSYKKEGGCMVDLHWAITSFINAGHVIVRELWENVISCEVDGIKYYELDEEGLLFYLSLHYTSGRHMTSLRYICDIGRFLEKYKDMICWGRLMEKANTYGVAASLYTALRASNRLLGSCIPVREMRKLKVGLIKRWLIASFTDRDVILKRNSRRKRFFVNFLWLYFSQIIEAKTLKDYWEVLFPERIMIEDRPYLRRICKGFLRLVQALHPKQITIQHAGITKKIRE